MAVARDDRFERFVHLDERSAGYFALGIGRATGMPAAVITTSGTAAANLHPAVIEAFHAEVPLIVLTADRPHRLRSADANQAIDQIRLFGTHVREFHEVAPPSADEPALRHLRTLAARAVSVAAGPPPGPVHLNFPFAKPLEPVPGADGEPPVGRPVTSAPGGWRDEDPYVRVVRGSPSVPGEAVEHVAHLFRSRRNGIIVVGANSTGDETGMAAGRLSAATGFPLLADPLSGARFGGPGRNVIGGYDLFLRDPEIRQRMRPDLILRVGATPTSASLTALLEESTGARQIVIDLGGRWKDHLSVASEYVEADAAKFFQALSGRLTNTIATDAWRKGWARVEEVTQAEVKASLSAGLFEGVVVAEAVAGVATRANLFISNSMPVRDLDAFVAPTSKMVHVYGNRGASGIDGIVSSALGVQVGTGRRTVAVLGDIAMYHDMNGLLAAAKYGLDVCFVVIHNDGGGIFQTLPIREHEPEFTSYFLTPHGINFRGVAQLYGIPYWRVTSSQDLRESLEDAMNADGPAILEVPLDRQTSHRRRQEVVAAVATAVKDELGKGVLA
jgi:2-succinyl-5-enolpyruvyl-6-hydroxy-3-cyclohexene-1-carboxylate synthase